MWRLPEFISQEDLMDKPLILLLVLASVLQTSITYSPKERRPRLVNQDVVALLAHGLPESLVLTAIKTTENEFDVSGDGLCNLKRAGVSNQVIDAMLSAKLKNSR